MRAAIVKNGIVENIIIVNSLGCVTLEDCTIVEVVDFVDIGYTYAEGVFTPPETPPEE